MSNFTIIIGCAVLLAFGSLLAGFLLREDPAKYKPIAIMTANELEFFLRLTRALTDLHVFPQVAISALIAPSHPDGKKRMAAFRQISQKRVDWAIYSSDMKLICVVELDDRTHDSAKDAARDAMLDTAGIKTIRWHSRKKPTVVEIRTSIDQLLKA